VIISRVKKRLPFFPVADAVRAGIERAVDDSGVAVSEKMRKIHVPVFDR
jgi:hypothetical protein